jgi:hypothetical protein
LAIRQSEIPLLGRAARLSSSNTLLSRLQNLRHAGRVDDAVKPQPRLIKQVAVFHFGTLASSGNQHHIHIADEARLRAGVFRVDLLWQHTLDDPVSSRQGRSVASHII